ncbi:guanylate kinase [Bombilactobacillus thymidiniphilus]|uniref:AAA family ATPase n=1 Tax=Bombilactobacillus thymidiniphilus TaxID=2923363 RepID=A0ABY4PF57_9LACO|nr:AAA family ATPase [Bombilactobacillus thymidiniphilus]UQS84344.1 AAA family ATPase [Bombilactobacillus thymidiniphilus]
MVKKIIILTGASGTGKTTVSHYLTNKYDIPAVITHTTRQQRSGEQDGVDYYFETPASFQLNSYLEQVNYDGHFYGSSIEGIQRAWQKADLVSIVLDTKGAKTYVQHFGQQAVVLFLTLTPAVLQRRLYARGDQRNLIQQRLRSVEFQRDLQVPAALKYVAQVLVNDDWNQLQRQLDAIIKRLQ